MTGPRQRARRAGGPGRGAARRRGKGYSVNVPLKDGMDDAAYTFLFRPIMRRVMEIYQPEVIVFQSGARPAPPAACRGRSAAPCQASAPAAARSPRLRPAQGRRPPAPLAERSGGGSAPRPAPPALRRRRHRAHAGAGAQARTRWRATAWARSA